MDKIRIGIMGYGNLGRGVEAAVAQNPDTELIAVFTRRPPDTVKVKSNAMVVSEADAAAYTDKIDVLILCGGSATDLPEQGPKFAAMFNTVDSFDTHARIPEYYEKVNAAAQASGKVGIISVGWDPGLFSLNRLYANAVLTDGKDYTFWGKGVSQGHSDAVRCVKGVKNAVQYTVPVDDAIAAARSGNNPDLTVREKHKRVCYVVAEDGADKAAIADSIKKMPNYFADYDTEVNFITEEELKKDHSAMPHGGFVIRGGKSGGGYRHVMEFSLKLDSNPEFTACVLLAYARAAFRLAKEGNFGAKTVFDIPPAYLSAKTAAELRKTLL